MNDTVEQVPAEIPGTAVIEYGITEAVLAELREFWKGITEVTDENYDTVKTGCNKLVKLRTGIEAKRNDLLSGARDYTDSVNVEAKRVTGLVKAIETPAKKLKEDYDAEQKAAKDAADKKEKERTDAINAAIDQIDALGNDLDGMSVDMLSARLSELKSLDIAEAIYAEFLAVAVERHESAVAKVEAARYRRIEFEAEQRKLKEEGEALEKQRQIDADKLAEQQAEIDRQKKELADAQQKLADEQTERNAELARQDREAQEAEDAAAQEKRDNEIAEAAAIEERERLAREAQDRELAEAEARELAPDKDKLLTYARDIAELSAAAPTLEHAKAQKMLERAVDDLDRIANGLMDWAGKV